MTLLQTLQANLLAPIPLAFALGVTVRLLRSTFALPSDLYQALSIYLLFALGLKGGVELSHASLHDMAFPVLATLLLGVITPCTAFVVAHRVGKLSVTDAAGVAAHYGSVSAVTFIASQQFLQRLNVPVEGYMSTLLTLLESPGIHIALAVGVLHAARHFTTNNVDTPERRAPAHSVGSALHEVFTGQTMVLLVGGLLVGWLMGAPGWSAVAPFFDSGFKGALMLFLLEMGVVAAGRIGDLRKVGVFVVAYGILVPILHGVVGAALATMAGLSVGGATVLATMAASASYIAAPPAVRTTLPDANPTLSLTAALAVIFPFNVLFGIPLYFRFAQALA